MPPNVTNVVPEILMVTSQKRAGNTGEFESALSTAIEGQTSPAPNAEAPEAKATTETEPTEPPATIPEIVIPENMLAVFMALLAQPPVVVPTPQPQPQAKEVDETQPAPELTPKTLPIAAGLPVTNEQPAPTTADDKAPETEVEPDPDKEIPFQVKHSTSKEQPAPVKAAAVDPAKLPDPPRSPLAGKEQPKAEAVPNPIAVSMPEVVQTREQKEAPAKGDVPQLQVTNNISAVNSPAPAASKPSDMLVEAATLSPLEQATMHVPEPIRTVAMSIGRLTAELGQEVRLQLHPESLGRLDVKLNYEGAQVHVHLSAEVPQTSDLIQQHQTELRSALAEAGVTVGQLTVTVGDGRPQQERGFTPDERLPAPTIQSKIAPTAARKPDVKTSLIDYRV